MSFLEESIFKNEEVLSPEYLPDLLPHREDEIKQLARNLSPVAQGRRAQNTFLFGAPGIGKTATVKFIFREFEDYSTKAKTIYINCWDYKTAHAVFSKIALELQVFVQRRGTSKDEVLERLIEVSKKKNKGLVVCLDEVEQLQQEALYDLLRINQYIKNPVGIVFISNDPHVFVEMDPRIRSSLNVEEIEFKPYNLEEMKDILKERAAYAFNSFEQGIVLIAANHAVKNGGDVRIGLECLLKAGREAERDGSDKVGVTHIKKILPTVKPIKPKILEEKVSEVEKIILKIVKEKRKLFSDELYEFYCKEVKEPLTRRAFRNYVKHLGKVNLIKIVPRKRGTRGKKTVILRV